MQRSVIFCCDHSLSWRINLLFKSLSVDAVFEFEKNQLMIKHFWAAYGFMCFIVIVAVETSLLPLVVAGDVDWDATLLLLLNSDNEH